MAVLNDIAEAVVTVLAGLPGAPTLIEFRETDVLHAREMTAGVDAAIVTSGTQTVLGYTFEGGKWVNYPIRISVYRRKLGDVSTGKTLNPDFEDAAKAALDRPTLAGAPTVFGCTLEANDSWGKQGFGQGYEKSMFRIDFTSNESRN